MVPKGRGGFAVLALWATGIALALFSANVCKVDAPPEDCAAIPYEWHWALYDSAVVTIESLVLFWLLFKLATPRPPVRTLIALGSSSALVAVGLFAPTALPLWYGINTLWAMLATLMLAMRLIVQFATTCAHTRRSRA